jgi:hypothetical protein
VGILSSAHSSPRYRSRYGIRSHYLSTPTSYTILTITTHFHTSPTNHHIIPPLPLRTASRSTFHSPSLTYDPNHIAFLHHIMTQSAITAPTRSHKSSRPRTYLPLETAISLTAKLFNPKLKPHRPFRIPTPPSIRASQLPPPCAELDERPKRRVRRFMLWTDKVPPLRLVVLDPKKRGMWSCQTGAVLVS